MTDACCSPPRKQFTRLLPVSTRYFSIIATSRSTSVSVRRWFETAGPWNCVLAFRAICWCWRSFAAPPWPRKGVVAVSNRSEECANGAGEQKSGKPASFHVSEISLLTTAVPHPTAMLFWRRDARPSPMECFGLARKIRFARYAAPVSAEAIGWRWPCRTDRRLRRPSYRLRRVRFVRRLIRALPRTSCSVISLN